MGVVHKLKSEVEEFILETKKNKPVVSCRNMAALVNERFKVEVSKSSINALIKKSGLSLPVGRRPKPKRKRPERLIQAISEASRSFQLPAQSGQEEGIYEIKSLPQKTPLVKEEKEEPVKSEIAPVSPEIEKNILPQETKAGQYILPPVEGPPASVPAPAQEKEIPPTEKEEPPKLESTPVIPPAEEFKAPEEAKPEEALKLENLPVAEPAIPQETKKEEVLPVQAGPIQPESQVSAVPEPEPAPRPAFTPLESIAFTLPKIALPVEREGLGAVLLKAAGALTGCSIMLAQAIRKRLKGSCPDLLAKTEALFYSALFGSPANPTTADSALWPLINRQFSPTEISDFNKELEQVKLLNSELLLVIAQAFQEVRGAQMSLTNNKVIYLDGQLRTLWSIPQIPYDFASLLNPLVERLEECFVKDSPFVFFSAPGYEKPSPDFFDFLSGFECSRIGINRLTLYGNKFEELKVLNLEGPKKRFFIFGVWPWQFSSCRKVEVSKEFQMLDFAPLKQNYAFAEGKITLTQPNTGQSVVLRIIALKNDPAQKIRVVIATNLPVEKVFAEEVAKSYLLSWPNLEETFEDFSRKIELFTYAANSQRFFNLDDLSVGREMVPSLAGLSDYYLRALDTYVRWHFLPHGYEERDFDTLKEFFYQIKAKIEKQDGFYNVTFQPHPGYAYNKELGYACRRLNEQKIVFYPDGKTWFNVQ